MADARRNPIPLEAGWPLLLRDLGVSTANVLRRAELPEDLFAQSGASLDVLEYFRLWLALEREVNDPTLPLRIGRALTIEVFSPPLFAALCSPNLAVAVQRLAHYKRLIVPATVHIHEDDAVLSIEVEWMYQSVPPPMSLSLTELVFIVQLARVAIREPVCPLRVESSAPLTPAAEYQRYFGVAVQRSDTHKVTFSTAVAHKPFLTVSEAMWAVFEPTLRRRLAELDESATTEERVRAALLEGLPSGASSMEQIAHKLALSKRTLQRRLHAEGTTFQAVLRQIRENLARHYLAKTSLSGTEISYLLGFEDPNSFFRAFQEWTGMTTEQVRLDCARSSSTTPSLAHNPTR